MVERSFDDFARCDYEIKVLRLGRLDLRASHILRMGFDRDSVEYRPAVLCYWEGWDRVDAGWGEYSEGGKR